MWGGLERKKIRKKIILNVGGFSTAILGFDMSSETGFVQVMENLESHGIGYFNFQALKVMEFK